MKVFTKGGKFVVKKDGKLLKHRYPKKIAKFSSSEAAHKAILNMSEFAKYPTMMDYSF